MPERGCGGLERRHQVAQHPVVGVDLVLVAPAIDQARRFIKRGVDEVGCALQFGRCARALDGIGQVDRDVAGAMQFPWLAAGQRNDLSEPGGGHPRTVVGTRLRAAASERQPTDRAAALAVVDGLGSGLGDTNLSIFGGCCIFCHEDTKPRRNHILRMELTACR